MALSESALSDLLASLQVGDGVDLVRELARWALQELIEAEAAAAIGAGRYERSDGRVNERNGHRPRVLSTKAGDLHVGIPKLRAGSFFPSLLEPRRRIDQALYAVVMEAYVEGVSTRAVDDLVEAMGIDSGMKKSEVSRICAGIDERVAVFRNRTLGHVGFPYLYLDATYVHVRDDALGQVVSRAVVIATGITAGGEREILGVDIGDSEDETFWTGFLRGLRSRGLGGVRLVISDGPRRPARRHPQGHPGRLVAALPRALRPQPPGPRPQGPSRDGLRRVPLDLRPRRPRRRPSPLRRGHRHPRRPLPEGRRLAARRPPRRPRLRLISP